MRIKDVFTPRSAEVNENMYVKRPAYEKKLLMELDSGMHLLLFGESGNGKSWLYKHVFNKNKIPYIIINGANASRFNSITNGIYDSVIKYGTAIKTSFEEEKKAEISALLAKAEVNHNGHFEIKQNEPLLESFIVFSSLHDTENHVMVIDNLEFITSSPKLLDELSDIIILLDDPVYAQYNITFLIVGLPFDILEYFSTIKNVESVANRLIELPKVQSLLPEQVSTIVYTGFRHYLGYSITDTHLDFIAKEIYSITMGIAQKVQDFCRLLATEIDENNYKFEIKLLESAEKSWLFGALRKSYKIMELNLDGTRAKIGRKNQVIFIIGRLTSHQFDVKKIENEIKVNFPKTSSDNHMGIKGILTTLSSGDNKILTHNEKTGEYSLIDPRYAMCIRVSLYKNNEKIIKKQFTRT